MGTCDRPKGGPVQFGESVGSSSAKNPQRETDPVPVRVCTCVRAQSMVDGWSVGECENELGEREREKELKWVFAVANVFHVSDMSQASSVIREG